MFQKKRVLEHGEVFTADREINNMLDLVKEDSYCTYSRFLGPAAGHGNFLVKILKRKLNSLAMEHKEQTFFEKHAIVVVGSIYGIEILEDNVNIARKRMLELFKDIYAQKFKKNVRSDFLKIIKYLLTKNIIHGDTLKYEEMNTKEPITFCEWKLEGEKIKRRDFTLESLINNSSTNKNQEPLFDNLNDDEHFIEPTKEYNAIQYYKLASLC